MRAIKYEPLAFEQMYDWFIADRKTAIKIHKLIKECQRTPFEGIGKPEPLKGDLRGYWSRQINIRDRMVYEVSVDQINIISLKGHYD